jgi:hypothetical protein
MKLDARLSLGGGMEVVTVVPECAAHGTEPVVMLDDGRWKCTACEQIIELRDGELHRTHPWDLVAMQVI